MTTGDVRWGEGGPVVGKVTGYDPETGTVDMEITDPTAQEALTDHGGSYSIGVDGATFVPPRVNLNALAEKITEWGRTMTRIQFDPGSQATRALREIGKMLAEPLDPDVPPTDPRDRALWLRQHRNTGPAPKSRKRPK